MSSYDGRRHSSAAGVYPPAPAQGYALNPNPNYDPGAQAQPGSIPYGPTEPAVLPTQPQHPGMRRPSSYQQPPTAPMPIPQHPGLQAASSYGPSASGMYGNSPATSQYGSSPQNSHAYGTTPPTSYASHQMQSQCYPVPPTAPMPNGAPPMPNGAYPPAPAPPRPGYSDRYDESAIAYDDEPYGNARPRDSRRYSRSSYNGEGHERRRSRPDAYEDAYDINLSPHDSRGRRGSRASKYEDDDDDRYEEPRRRRESKASTHSNKSRSSRHKKDKPPTYGDSVEWAFRGIKKIFS